jgi:hypothetical protein
MNHRSFFSDFSRRDFFRMSLAGATGVSGSGWMDKLARAVDAAPPQKACILLWMPGGPSQTDTFDLKPGHKNGGPFKEIATAVPGVRISEHLPGLAKQMEDIAIIRSLTSTEGDHGRAANIMLTGYKEQEAVKYPVLGSLVAKELGRQESELPNFVSISSAKSIFGSTADEGFLGPRYAPLAVSGNSSNPQARANLSIEFLAPPRKVDKTQIENRFRMLQAVQRDFGDRFDGDSVAAHRSNYEKAERLVKSQARNAFRLDEEESSLRDAYGRNRFGQGCLLARRLVERGVPFVEVALNGTQNNAAASWDTHADNFNQVKLLSQVLDPAWATLMRDLRDRGMLDDTLVVWMGEFGRTPNINEMGGRDHFPQAWSSVLCGAGIQGGQAYGSSGVDGMKVVDKPVKGPELIATICSALGVNCRKENFTDEGRPIPIVERGTEPVAALLRG